MWEYPTSDLILSMNVYERELMAALHCTCENKNKIWGEFWWKAEEGKHSWIYFDNEETSGTYREKVTHCPGCGVELHRKTLLAA